MPEVVTGSTFVRPYIDKAVAMEHQAEALLAEAAWWRHRAFDNDTFPRCGVKDSAVDAHGEPKGICNLPGGHSGAQCHQEWREDMTDDGPRVYLWAEWSGR